MGALGGGGVPEMRPKRGVALGEEAEASLGHGGGRGPRGHPGVSLAIRGGGSRQTRKPPVQRRELRLERWTRWPQRVQGGRRGKYQEQHPGKTRM